jgi:hypothetical protein
VQGDGTSFRLDGTGNTSRGILLRNTGTGEGYVETDGNMHFRQEDAGRYMRFSTANTERMRITSAGNVGIGTSAPGNRLTVAGGAFSVGRGSNGISATFASGDGVNDTSFQINHTTSGIQLLNSNPHTGAFNNLSFSNTSVGETMRITDSGALILVGSTAQKATGTTWSNPSDQRLKDNIRDYAKGTAELMQVRVREWEYNGKGGTIEGTKGLGVVADEVMAVLPDTVANYEAKLNADDEEVTAIKKFDATEITWLLVKTAQEQQAIIESLKTRIEALEGTQP